MHLHYAGAGFQMQVVLLTRESACYFWWMLLLSRWSGHGVRCDLVIRELRDWWKLFLEEQMQSGSLLGAAALLCIAPFKEKKTNKQPWRCFQNICLKGECWEQKRACECWQRYQFATDMTLFQGRTGSEGEYDGVPWEKHACIKGKTLL